MRYVEANGGTMLSKETLELIIFTQSKIPQSR